MNKGRLTYEDLPGIYEKLSADLPIEAAEHVPAAKSRKGYDTTGYGYQFCVNRLNEVVFGHWRAVERIVKEETGKTNSGKQMYKIVIFMTIQIGNWHFIEGENKFEVLAEVGGYGGHESLEEASAYKGAYTNAFKKAVAMLGVGKKAFEGTLDEDLFAVEAQEQPQPKQPAQRQQQMHPQQRQQTQQQKPTGLATVKQRKKMFAVAKERGINPDEMKEIIVARTGKDSTKKLTSKEASELIEYLMQTEYQDVYESFEQAEAGGQ